jgi:hypothetical protein
LTAFPRSPTDRDSGAAAETSTVSTRAIRHSLTGALALGAVLAATATPVTRASTGGAGITLKKRSKRHARGAWYHGVTITEYWPAPESWFVGAPVAAPGLTGKHRIDWLYSAAGLSMEGEGIGLDGQLYHIDSLGRGGWVTAAGRGTSSADGWSAGTPYWRAGAYWLSRRHAVTFPLAAGGWSAGAGRRYVPLRGVSFAPGASRPLRFYQSIAVDPEVIPLGSRVYIPSYRTDGHGGWFVAQDTGGAIRGRHIDVFRPPPAIPFAAGAFLTGEKVYVIRPRRR